MGWTENENSSEVKDAEKPAENKKESMLPCLMIMCGSGCGFLKVRHLLKSERKKIIVHFLLKNVSVEQKTFFQMNKIGELPIATLQQTY